jgi:hypothetical protein
MVILNVQESVGERRVVNAKKLSLSDQSINLCKFNFNNTFVSSYLEVHKTYELMFSFFLSHFNTFL